MKRNIGPFKLYTKKPNAIDYGYLYTMNVVLPVPHCKNRTVRVYLPENYDESERYPVIYMADGQNIVDRYTTAYGEWDIDIHEHNLIQQGVRPFIVVGIDCPNIGHLYRTQEYSLMDVPVARRYAGRNYDKKAYSQSLMDYVVKVLKPLIDATFPTLSDRDNTGVGGSSMGGIFSFNFATVYKDVFGFALSFSPAFHIYEQKVFDEYVKSLNLNPEEYGKFFFYTGDVEFEHLFFKPTIEMYKYFRSCGFSHDQVRLIVDSSKPHAEASWSEYFETAMKFWLA